MDVVIIAACAILCGFDDIYDYCKPVCGVTMVVSSINFQLRSFCSD